MGGLVVGVVDAMFVAVASSDEDAVRLCRSLVLGPSLAPDISKLCRYEC